MKLTRLLPPLLAAFFAVSPAAAQRGGDGNDFGDRRAFRGGRAGFDESGLKIGDAFPAVDIFDARGKAFNTASLKGRFTVVVSGCLT